MAGGLAAQQQLLRMQAGLSPTHMALADMAAMQSGGGLGSGVPGGLGAMGLLGPQARACAPLADLGPLAILGGCRRPCGQLLCSVTVTRVAVDKCPHA